MKNIDESSLIKRAQTGDKRAFEQIVGKFERQIYSFCYRFFGNEDDAMDATQEVFLKIYRSIKTFEGKSSLKTWVYRIASNTCITLANHKKKEKEGFLHSILNWWIREESVDTPEELAVNKEKKTMTKEIVTEKLATIQDVYRIPVIKKDLKGMNLEEISQIKEITKGTVKSRINRGRRLLQEKLRHFHDEVM